VLGAHVAQSGSLVAPDRLRFDFNHYEAVSPEDLKEVERLVNQRIRENAPVTLAEMTLQEAKERGAIALFGEKYGDMVRVVQLGDYSMELCGGTHLDTAGQIGEFKIISEGSIAAGVRRIEALTGETAYLYERQIGEQLLNVADLLRVKPTEVADRVESLLQQNKDLEREITRLRQQNARLQAEKFSSSSSASSSSSSSLGAPYPPIKVNFGGLQVTGIFRPVENVDRNGLLSMVDNMKAQLGSSAVVLGTETSDGKIIFAAGVTEGLIKKGLKAGDLVRKAAAAAGGSGGGRPDMAQGGGKDPSKMEEALSQAKEYFLATTAATKSQ
jgi:alanyl-tRNA synthetase